MKNLKSKFSWTIMVILCAFGYNIDKFPLGFRIFVEGVIFLMCVFYAVRYIRNKKPIHLSITLILFSLFILAIIFYDYFNATVHQNADFGVFLMIFIATIMIVILLVLLLGEFKYGNLQKAKKRVLPTIIGIAICSIFIIYLAIS